MKNYFKKLSFVMALAMLICAIAPAAGAFAAAGPALNSTKKYLHLSGEAGPSDYDFNVKNKVTGWKFAWSSANENVAVVDDANGKTSAVGVGRTTVSVKITKAGKTVKTLKATVVVRDNIDSVDISNVPTTKILVNAEYDFNRSFVTGSGSTTKTSSITRWSVDKTTATISDAGVFKATEAGNYSVTALAFQSKAKYETWKTSKDATLILASKEITVTVVPTITVAQKDLDTIVLTSDAPMTDAAKNISVYTVIGTTEVLVTTAKAATVSADKKTATVDFYVALTEGATYVVKYTGLDPIKLTTATAKIEDVSKVVLKTTEAEVGKAIGLEAQLFNAAGIEITKTDLTNRVTFSTTATVGVYVDGGAKTIMFFAKGNTAQVEATFHTYKYETGKEVGNITGSGTVVGVDASARNIGTVKAWTIVDRTVSKPAFTDLKQTLAVNETKKIAVQLNTKTGTKEDTLSTNDVDNKITFTSSDNTILIIDNVTKNLYPVKAGTVTIVVKQDEKTVDVIVLTVGAERKAATIVLGKTDLTISNSTAVHENAKVSVKVKDQYGDDMTIVNSDITITRQSGSPEYVLAQTSGTDVVFTGAVGATSATKGTYYYSVKAKDLTAYVTAVVIQPSAATPSYKLALSATEVDNKSVKDATRPTITVNLFGYADGAKVQQVAVSGATYTVIVKDAAGVETTLANTTLSDTTYDLFTASASASGSAITPKKAGTYTVTLKNAANVTLDVQYFTVKNTQTKPTFEIVPVAYTKATLTDIARECFKVSFKGDDVTSDITMSEADVIGTIGTNIFVKSVRYIEHIEGSTDTIEHTVDIAAMLNKK